MTAATPRHLSPEAAEREREAASTQAEGRTRGQSTPNALMNVPHTGKCSIKHSYFTVRLIVKKEEIKSHPIISQIDIWSSQR